MNITLFTLDIQSLMSYIALYLKPNINYYEKAISTCDSYTIFTDEPM